MTPQSHFFRFAPVPPRETQNPSGNSNTKLTCPANFGGGYPPPRGVWGVIFPLYEALFIKNDPQTPLGGVWGGPVDQNEGVGDPLRPRSKYY